MIQIVNSPNGQLLYPVPHVFSTIVDNSVVPGYTTSTFGGTLFTPIYTDKGITNTVKYFSGTNGASKLIETFGQPNTRKLGIPYTAAYEHALQPGGNVAVVSVKHKTATNAGFIVNLIVETEDQSSHEKITKTLGWILSDGTSFVADENASDASTKKPSPQHTVHKIETVRFRFEVEELTNINSSDELESVIQNMIDTETEKSGVQTQYKIPFIWGIYKGKGAYGNNFQAQFSTTGQTVKGRPYFGINIYDKREDKYIEGTKQTVSLNTDRIDTIPLFIQRRFQMPYSTGEFYFNTLDNNEFDFIGEKIEKLMKGITLFPNGAKVAGAEAEVLQVQFDELTTRFAESEDEDFHRISKFDPTNLNDYKKFYEAKKLITADFTGGSEGILSDLARKGFSFERTYNVAPTGQPVEEEKVLQDMFAGVFLGKYTNDVYNLLANNCDYIIDFGYPLEVKKAMINFASNRDDVQVLLNAPLETGSVAEAISWKQSFNQKGRNIYYFTGSFNYIDTRSDKSFRVPTTFAVMFNVVAHYVRGFDDPICGIDNGAITGVESGSGKGFGDMSLESNTKLWNNGFNIISSHSDGLLYLDSQRSNYLITEISDLQLFFNNSIINRILKKLYLSLQFEKHRLNSEEAVAKITSKINNELLSEFSNKVKSINYEGIFESAYTQAIGVMQHRIKIDFFNCIQSHQIYIEAVSSAA